MQLPEHIEEDLAVGMHRRGMIALGRMTSLHSGRETPYYFDARRFMSVNVRIAERMPVGEQLALRSTLIGEYSTMLRRVPHPYQHVVGKAQAGTGAGFVATATVRAGLSYLWERVFESQKSYGIGKPPIEGDYLEGQLALSGDDVITNGESKIAGFDTIRGAGMVPVGAVVILDRNEGGVERLLESDYWADSLTTISRVARYLLAEGLWGNEELDAIAAYHARLHADGLPTTYIDPRG